MLLLVFKGCRGLWGKKWGDKNYDTSASFIFVISPGDCTMHV